MVTSRAHRVLRSRRYAVATALVGALLAAGSPALAGSTGPSSAPDEAAVTTSAPDDAAVTSTPPQTQAEARPRLNRLQRPLGAVADGPVPDPAALDAAIEDELGSDWLGPRSRRAVTVRDALTGDVLAGRNADRAVTPASTAKILSAAAIVTGLDVEHTFSTRVVAGASPDEIVLVAGGDMLLAREGGDPGAVAGHAGLGDLAELTAAALEARGVTGEVAVLLDLQHVAGPHKLDSWSDFWIDEGYAGRIVQLGLAEDLALPFYPAPRQPEQEVARAFASALVEAGVKVAETDGEAAGSPDWDAEVVTAPADPTAAQGAQGADDDASATAAPRAGQELARVESAPMREVLALALALSDNAMVEQLARQAAVAAGRTADQPDVLAWIEESLAQVYGLDLTGLGLADASGLSSGTRLTVDAVADILVAGADGSHPDLQSVLAAGGLPIAGYTGTLAPRFHLPVHAPAIGNARAKTGSLPGVTSLAGTVVTADGRLLVFAMTADDIGEDGAVLEARSVLDEIVAELARCGC